LVLWLTTPAAIRTLPGTHLGARHGLCVALGRMLVGRLLFAGSKLLLEAFHKSSSIGA
jgi:hypothetical protein